MKKWLLLLSLLCINSCFSLNNITLNLPIKYQECDSLSDNDGHNLCALMGTKLTLSQNIEIHNINDIVEARDIYIKFPKTRIINIMDEVIKSFNNDTIRIITKHDFPSGNYTMYVYQGQSICKKFQFVIQMHNTAFYLDLRYIDLENFLDDFNNIREKLSVVYFDKQHQVDDTRLANAVDCYK